MKISAYYKSFGAEVELKMDYNNLEDYDKVRISKVFIDTEIPFESPDKSLKTEATVSEFYKDNPILNLPNVEYGGTGFYYDKSPFLPFDVEHIMPDYHLYDDWVKEQLEKGVKPKELEYYTKWSIGFATRGCVRQCEFCVNKNYTCCVLHSALSEFVDKDRPYICLLDDNVYACPQWKTVFDALEKTGKRFQFKQGLDERFLTEDKCEILFNCRWKGDRIFAFDNIKDKELIINRLELIRRYTKETIKFYTFCAFNHDKPDYYDKAFYRKDIEDLFERVKILMEYGCMPFVMKYKDYEKSPYKGFYMAMAWWCNQPSKFKKQSFREFCEANQERAKISSDCAAMRYLKEVERDFPDIAKKYFDLKYDNLNKFKEVK